MLALLHTSPLHVPVFDALRDAHHPGLVLRHLVDEELLARAGAEGPEAVAEDVGALLVGLAAEGAGAVLCTCSTIGAVAESAAVRAGVPVLRVDRPMAAEAVADGRRVVVLAAVASTLEPTARLLAEEAHRAGRVAEVRTALVEGAWELFAAGDTEAYARRIADAVRRTVGAEVVVLAQASMAGAERLLGDLDGRVRVLSSPRPGLAAAAAEVLRARGTDTDTDIAPGS
ncbi:arylsulfatase [Streptomyces sp. NA04227]|uniref:aspartate/glutamate racemase family protein n=1 Tax=Streptomyces sp. NA04227 TaxID=2742136 RepID=UPI0015926FA7|nr:aspartate/glutamate racemase family protein [Streptomyces sp. NA04227]QKW11287.1 arylsulfatase [Streptomyces sp. NA04227]